MGNNYKQTCHTGSMHERGKKGQVALWAVIAIAIIALVLLIFIFPKNIKKQFSLDVNNPGAYIENCMKQDLIDNLDKVSKQGGFLNPEGKIRFNNSDIKYLCYTSENYKTCTVQEPFIKERIEQELNSVMKEKAKYCVEKFSSEIKNKGNSVSISNVDSSVSLIPDSVIVSVSAPMTITSDVSRTYKTFSFSLQSKYYELSMIALSIVGYESVYGNAETTLYSQYYPDIVVKKVLLNDGTRIYIITNIITKETFQFASRSLVWPPGYEK